MPKLWTETIEAHRRDVRDAILNTTAALVAENGLLSVTMSQIAEKTGIGRATLYKYFADVEAILVAWHDGQIARHLAHLAELRDRPGNARERLESVLEAYALISRGSRGRDDGQLVAFLHQGRHVARAEDELRELVRGLIAEAAAAGEVRNDVPPVELADFSLHALGAAATLPSRAAVGRLVTVTIAGMERAPDST
jgi:AcrR family transcriptional regulator